jgi:hypothetical protein
MTSVPSAAELIHLGMDTSVKEIVVAVLRPGEEVPAVDRVPNDEESVRRLIARLPDRRLLSACYEAGPGGYELYRLLTSMGVACDVVAPSLVPKGSSDRVKTDRRDSVRLALTHRAGLLTAVRVPSPAEEAVRDLVRARGDLLDDRKRMQQRLGAMLMRHGRIWRGGKKWGYAHRTWVDQQVFDEPALAEALALYRGGLEAREAELTAAEARLAAWAGREPLAGPVARLGGYRGIAQLTGLTLAAEVAGLAPVRLRPRVHGLRRADPDGILQRVPQPPRPHHQGRPGGGAHRLDRGSVGLPVPAGHRGHAAPQAGRPVTRDAGPVLEGAAAAARQVHQDDRPRQAARRRRGGGRPRAGRLRVGGDDQLIPFPGAGAAAPAIPSWRCTGTHAAAGMIPVYVLSEPTLAISVGHRPAHSRPANPIREYEPGSGESHDHDSVHRPHPPRPPPAVSRPRRAAMVRGRPSGLNGALARIASRRPAAAVDPGASATAAGRQSRQARACPSRHRPAGHSRQPPLHRITRHAGSVHHARQHTLQKPHYRTNGLNGRPADSKGLTGPFHMNIRSGAHAFERSHGANCAKPV